MKKQSTPNNLKRIFRRSALSVCLLLAASASAYADDYLIFGRVLKISPDEAADVGITDSGLTGDNFPFAHVRVFDASSGALLGEADAGINGQYTVAFSLPAAAPAPRVEIRAYEELDGSSTLLPEAREGINIQPAGAGGISPFQFAFVKVENDDILEYGGSGFRSYPGIGLVFTRVGKVEIPEISQTPGSELYGVADYTGNFARADQLGVPRFQLAPFARRLLIFGDFGLPGGSCTGDQVDWYQVDIQEVDSAGNPVGAAFPWQDPMSKRRTQITTLPTLSVNVTTEQIGPFAGFADNPATIPVDAGAPLDDLYFVNRNVAGGLTTTIYSFPDLRVNWVSNLYGGFYRLSLVYFKEVGTAAGGAPILEQLPSTCFAGSVPSGDADDVALHELDIRVDNSALDVSFDGIFLRNRSTGGFYQGPSMADGAKATAHDFNSDGLCDIMPLASTYNVEIDFTAHHAGSFMRTYRLHAVSNDGAGSFLFADDDFTGHTGAGDPDWEGTPAGGTTVPAFAAPAAAQFTHRCAYFFNLSGTSRQQNGYNFVQWRHPQRAYFVDVP